VFGLAAAGFFLSLVPPLLLRQLVDNHLTAGIAAGIWRLAAFYLLAYLAASIVGFVQSYLTTLIGQQLLLEFRSMLSRHLARLPMAYYSRTPAGDIISRVTSDVDAVSNLFSSGLLSAFTDFFRIGGVLVGMYIVSPRLFLLSLAVIPLIYLATDWFRRHMFAAEMRIRRSVSQLNSFIQETFNGLRLIKAFGYETLYDDHFQQPLADNVTVSNRAAFYVAAFPCVMQFLRAGVIAVVIWAGARTSVTDALAVSIGGLAAMVDLLGRLLDPVEAVANEVQVLQQAFAGLTRLAELMSQAPEDRGPVTQLTEYPGWQTEREAVTLTGVTYAYTDDAQVIRGVSLSVRRGSKVALIGRTGAGKTTLMNLVAGLFSPWSGSIKVCGMNPHNLDPAQRRKLIGVVPQTPAVLEGTVLENITLRDETISEAQAVAACELIGLHDHLLDLPEGYQTMLGAGAMELSHGQRQLLSIARAVVCDPPVLLLDEPTSGMDTLTEQRVFEALRAASEQRTIVTISHRVSGIIDAETVCVLSGGRVVQEGSPQQLVGERGWYAMFRQLEDLGWQVQ